MDKTVLVSNLSKAFSRKETQNRMVIIPKGASNNDALIVNSVGIEILNLIDGKRNIKEIKRRLRDKYPQVPLHQLYSDAENYIRNLYGSGLIQMKGEFVMYTGKDIDFKEGYSIHRCGESEFNRIKKYIEKEAVVSLINAGVSESNYYPLHIRAKLFSFSEEFYFLEKDGEDVALCTIISGRNTINHVSSIGMIKQTKDLQAQFLADFVKECVNNYKIKLDSECRKIRFTKIIDNPERKLGEVFESVGFSQTAIFLNEFGTNQHHAIYDYNLS